VSKVSGWPSIACRLVRRTIFPERVSIQATSYDPADNPGIRSFPVTVRPAAGARL
jgi:hypothetical protein